jgi:hypothetical protein
VGGGRRGEAAYVDLAPLFREEARAGNARSGDEPVPIVNESPRAR